MNPYRPNASNVSNGKKDPLTRIREVKEALGIQSVSLDKLLQFKNIEDLINHDDRDSWFKSSKRDIERLRDKIKDQDIEKYKNLDTLQKIITELEMLYNTHQAKKYYIYISDGKIGRLMASKKSQKIIGLCTNEFTSCNILVLISEDKKRYVLIHMDGSLDIHKVIAEQMIWLGPNATFFNCRRRNSGVGQSSEKFISELKAYHPQELLIDHPTIQAITITLGDSKPRFEQSLPNNLLVHKDQALIYSQHRVEGHLGREGNTNFLKPLIFNGLEWSNYDSISLSPATVSHLAARKITLGKATALDIWKGISGYEYCQRIDMDIAGTILSYQFLIAHERNDERNDERNVENFLYSSLESCIADRDAKGIVPVIMATRRNYPANRLGFGDFFNFILAQIDEEYSGNRKILDTVQVILNACRIMSEIFPSSAALPLSKLTDSEAKHFSVPITTIPVPNPPTPDQKTLPEENDPSVSFEYLLPAMIMGMISVFPFINRTFASRPRGLNRSDRFPLEENQPRLGLFQNSSMTPQKVKERRLVERPSSYPVVEWSPPLDFSLRG